jgi:hypothetical protein
MIKRLKVAELRELLAQRNLDSSGLKNDLVERLISAINKENSEARANASSSTIDQPSEPTPSQTPSAPDTTTAEASHPTPTDHSATQKRPAPKEEEEEDNALALAGENSSAQKEQPVPEAAGATAATTTAHASPPQPKKRKTEGADGATSAEAKAEAEAEQRSRRVPPSRKSPSPALLIYGFVRPFTLQAVKELLEQTGRVQGFWMDQIKTHCYVVYESVEQAEATRRALYGLQWPPGISHKTLQPDFVPLEEARRFTDAAAAASTPTEQKERPGGSSGGAGAAEKNRARPVLATPLDVLFRKTRARPPLYWLPRPSPAPASSQSQARPPPPLSVPSAMRSATDASAAQKCKRRVLAAEPKLRGERTARAPALTWTVLLLFYCFDYLTRSFRTASKMPLPFFPIYASYNTVSCVTSLFLGAGGGFRRKGAGRVARCSPSAGCGPAR